MKKYNKITSSNILEITNTMITRKLNLRQTAELYNVARSTLHRKIHRIVKDLDPIMYKNVKRLFLYNRYKNKKNYAKKYGKYGVK